MRKKGQIYILAAIMFSIVIYGLSTIPNIVMQQEFKGDFEKLATNYEVESSKLINSVLLSEGDVMESFTNFTILFMSYSKSQNPNFGTVTSFSHENIVRIGNYLKKPILIDTGGEKLEYLNGCFDKISALLVFNGLVIETGVDIETIRGECFTTFDYEDIQYQDPVKIWIGFVEEREPPKVVWYPFEIKPNKPQLMMVNMQEEASQRQVNVGGEGYVVKEGTPDIPEEKIKEALKGQE